MIDLSIRLTTKKTTLLTGNIKWSATAFKMTFKINSITVEKTSAQEKQNDQSLLVIRGNWSRQVF